MPKSQVSIDEERGSKLSQRRWTVTNTSCAASSSSSGATPKRPQVTPNELEVRLVGAPGSMPKPPRVRRGERVYAQRTSVPSLNECPGRRVSIASVRRRRSSLRDRQSKIAPRSRVRLAPPLRAWPMNRRTSWIAKVGRRKGTSAPAGRNDDCGEIAMSSAVSATAAAKRPRRSREFAPRNLRPGARAGPAPRTLEWPGLERARRAGSRLFPLRTR